MEQKAEKSQHESEMKEENLTYLVLSLRTEENTVRKWEQYLKLAVKSCQCRVPDYKEETTQQE